MSQLFNIGKKQSINPFENIEYVMIDHKKIYTYNHEEARNKIIRLLNTTKEVNVGFINNQWSILYPIVMLDFTTNVVMRSNTEGYFTVNGKNNHGYIPILKIEFTLDNKIMII